MRSLDLVIDVGNSRTKLALFATNKLLRMDHAKNGDIAAVKAFLGVDRPVGVVLGATAAENEHYAKELEKIAPVLIVTGTTPSPLKSNYATPLTLGADRLANAVGSIARFPQRPVLAVDLGTCITYDLVEKDGTYAGGAITPGMQMRATAMNAYSARLPLVVPGLQPASIGISTGSSLEAGIHHGILGELKEFIASYVQERPGIAVTLTGGDAPRFVSALKSGIFALPFLTLEGLYAILIYNRALHSSSANAVR